MKTRSILPFAVLGILLVALFALSSCNSDDDGPGTAPTPTPDGLSAGLDDTHFDEPYSFALHGEGAEKKRKDFECYKEMGLSLSKAVILDDGLLQDSINKNEEFPVRTGSQKYDTQKYNFVITGIDGEEEIIVAQWDVEDIEAALKEAREKAKGENNCGGRKCLEDRGFIPEVSNKKVMVNVFPEDEEAADDEAADRKSPCWLDRVKGKGLLDAISKHLMLAQGVNDQDGTIGGFDKNRWYRWTAKEVRYAGVFFVDVDMENKCISDVDGDSGTYQPETSYQPLKAVWDYFESKVKMC